VNVFIRRAGVDPAERTRKEEAVAAYHRRRHLFGRALGVVSGAGHMMMGYTVRGFIFLLVTACLGASVVLWHGVAPSPLAVRSGVSVVRLGFTVAILAAVYALCLRDLLARQRADEGA